MKFKALLLDIDNTVYDYNSAHQHGMEMAYQYCETTFSLNRGELTKAFDLASNFPHSR